MSRVEHDVVLDDVRGDRKTTDKMEPNELSTFRRGKSKVFYASDIWDPGEEARTSFRSSCSDEDDDSFVASLLRRKTAGYVVDDYDFDDEIEEEMEYRTFFAPVHAKPSLSRPSVLNRSVELDDILEEEVDDREDEDDGDDENEGSPSPAAISSPSTHSPEGSFRDECYKTVFAVIGAAGNDLSLDIFYFYLNKFALDK